MLDCAYFHKEKLKEAWAGVAMDPHFRFVAAATYTNFDLEIKANTWHRLRWLSLSDKQEVVGWLEVSVNRETYYAHSMRIINMLGHPSITFGSDMLEFIRKLFRVWNFNKVQFAVAIGNPSEIIYDKFVEKYGGRVVGVSRRDARLPDGKIYDMKYYEFLRKNYLHSTETCGMC